MAKNPWIQEVLRNSATLVLAVATVELLLALALLTLAYAGYWFWMKKRRSASIHMGYIRFALVLTMSAAAIAGFAISDFYKADGWNWLFRGWLAGAAMALLLGIAFVLLIKRVRTPYIPWWFDPRIGDDD